MFGPLTLVARDPIIVIVLVLVLLQGLAVRGAVQARLAARFGAPGAVEAGYGRPALARHLGLWPTVWFLLLGLALPKEVPVRLVGRRAALVLLSGPVTLALWALLVMAVRVPLARLLPELDVVFQGLQNGAKAALLHAVFFLLPLPTLDGGRALGAVAGREVRKVLGQIALGVPIALYLVWIALNLSPFLGAILEPLWVGLNTVVGWLPL